MIDNCVRYRDLIIVCLFAEPFKMEEHQGKPCHNDSSNSKPLDFGDYMSTASTISSANSDNEEQEDIGKDSGGNSKVEETVKVNSLNEPGVQAPEISFELKLKNVVSLVMKPRKNVSLVKKVEENSRLLSICHWSLQEELKVKKVSNEYVRFLKLSEKHLEDENFHLKEEILASPQASLEQSNDLTIQKFEKVPKEEFVDSNAECAVKSGPDLEKIKQAISEIIDMKAELEQVKLKNAKKMQEKDQALIEAYKNLNDMKTKSQKWNREKLQNEKILQDKDTFIQSLKNIIDMDAKILKEKHLALTEASKQLIDLKAQAIIHMQLQEKVNQRNEKLVHEKDKAISELIDMKAELEQEKLQNAKMSQENDKSLTAVLPEMFSKLTI